MKKIIPSICMLLVTAVLMGTSTYAWFSMNRKVEVKGMQVSAVTSSNLIISKTEITDFANTNAFFVDYSEKGTYTSLSPVSSSKGKDFFVADKGAKENDSSTLLEGATFETTTQTKDGKTFWLEQTVYIGINGVDAINKQLEVVPVLTKLDTNDDTTTTFNDIYKALRFAVYYTDGTSAKDAVLFTGDLAATACKAVKAAGANSDAVKEEVTVNSQKVAIPGIDTIATNKNYKITIRIWLEGEDSNCTANNTNDASKALNGVSVSFVFTTAA